MKPVCMPSPLLACTPHNVPHQPAVCITRPLLFLEHANQSCSCVPITSMLSQPVHASLLLLLRLHALPKPSSCCSNRSWKCFHDSSSPCTRHYALVPSIKHCVWVGFIAVASSCLVQVHLGATMDYGIVLVAHQAASLYKTLGPCATVKRGRLCHSLCRCSHGLHTTICHETHVWVLARLASCALLVFETMHQSP